MHADLLKQLHDLGVVRGVRALAHPSPRRQVAIESLVPGSFHTTAHGRCFVAERDYPLDHAHGALPLGAFLELPRRLDPPLAVQLGGDPALAEADLHRALFFDTETTGLSGGAGTMAFVVGLGSFERDRFRLRQFFLRDPGDEPAMIEALAELLPAAGLLVSFNGRAFDVPILESRFILARMRSPASGLPHWDLLLPARRLWAWSLPSCSLGTLEQRVLGVLRDQDDVPSGLIPLLYRDYLRTGDARDMQRVLYHNAFDVLSLVGLAARLGRILRQPDSVHGLGPAEWYSLARWYRTSAQPEQAERAYRAALAQGAAGGVRERALSELAGLLKRAGRGEEALAAWQELAQIAAPGSPAHTQALVELAKHYEWQAGDAAQAATATRRAIEALSSLPPEPCHQRALAELLHRLARLERKRAQPA